MNVPIVAFFNNKGGVGKTSLVYHLAWMFADLGLRVVAADLDPQANLTAALVDEDRLESLWSLGERPATVFGCVWPLVRGVGDVGEPHLEPVAENLGLLAGDLGLSGFEDDLSAEWPACMDGKERAFRVISAFWRVLQLAIAAHHAELVLMDLGPNLGAINRAALIAADHVVVPLSPDLFSLQGLHNLGPRLTRWRKEWSDRLQRKPAGAPDLPAGSMRPAGYIVLQHSVRLDRPVKAYDKWIARIPFEYRQYVLEEKLLPQVTVTDDPHCLMLLKHYRSLMPMAQEARKPIFHLKAADGAIGAHFQAVQAAQGDFQRLAERVARQTGVRMPLPQ